MLKKMSNLHKITLVFLVFTLISLTFAADKNQKLNPKDPKHREEASKQGKNSINYWCISD